MKIFISSLKVFVLYVVVLSAFVLAFTTLVGCTAKAQVPVAPTTCQPPTGDIYQVLPSADLDICVLRSDVHPFTLCHWLAGGCEAVAISDDCTTWHVACRCQRQGPPQCEILNPSTEL
jgi:hypothetical protein